jgi:hypothetical protein|nr:MAG TPA_asm: hypothetical protein [Caudoviricetes sp.]
MVLNDILEKEELRREILNNNKSLNIMNKYKTITTINNMEYETLDRVAEYFEVDYDCIKRLIQRHKEELINNGLLILNGNKTRKILVENKILLTNYRGYFISDDRRFANKSNTLVNKRCFLNIAMLLRDSKVAQEIRGKILSIILNENSDNETLIINNTELFNKIEEQNKTINELSKIIKDLSDKIDDLNKNSKNLTTKNNDVTIINITNLDKFKTYLNSLDDNTTMSKKEYIDLFNKYEFYHKKIGITLFNKFMIKQKQFKTSERLTDRNKKKNLFMYEKNNNSKGIYITKKGLLYVTDLIVNNMNYYFK